MDSVRVLEADISFDGIIESIDSQLKSGVELVQKALSNISPPQEFVKNNGIISEGDNQAIILPESANNNQIEKEESNKNPDGSITTMAENRVAAVSDKATEISHINPTLNQPVEVQSINPLPASEAIVTELNKFKKFTEELSTLADVEGQDKNGQQQLRKVSVSLRNIEKNLELGLISPEEFKVNSNEATKPGKMQAISIDIQEWIREKVQAFVKWVQTVKAYFGGVKDNSDFKRSTQNIKSSLQSMKGQNTNNDKEQKHNDNNTPTSNT